MNKLDNIKDEDLLFKNPLVILNNLGTKLLFNELCELGNANSPIFAVEVKVDDQTFEGWGHSKREARMSAARACLSALLARAGRVLPSPADFTKIKAVGGGVKRAAVGKTRKPKTTEVLEDSEDELPLRRKMPRLKNYPLVAEKKTQGRPRVDSHAQRTQILDEVQEYTGHFKAENKHMQTTIDVYVVKKTRKYVEQHCEIEDLRLNMSAMDIDEQNAHVRVRHEIPYAKDIKELPQTLNWFINK